MPYGPAGDVVPARFLAVVDYSEHPLRLAIRATFNGTDPVRADAVTVERTDGESVAPADMARLQLGAVMGTVVWKATNSGRGTAMQGGRKHDGPPTDDELRTLARMYWFEHVSWGKPRQAVMSRFELPRSTANHWIRKAHERYGLPGPHASDPRKV